MLHREVNVRQRLGLYALGGVDYQERAFARSQASGDLVREVDMARRVYQIELVLLARYGTVGHAYSLGLYGDSALAFEVHRIQVLLDHVSGVDGTGNLKQTVSESGLAVVDVGDYAEVADEREVHTAMVAWKEQQNEMRGT